MEIFRPDVKKVFPEDENNEENEDERYCDELGELDSFLNTLMGYRTIASSPFAV